MEQGLNTPAPLLERFNNIFEEAISTPFPGEKWIMSAGLLGLLAHHYGLLGFIGLGATVEDSEPANNFGFLKDPHDELYPAAWIGLRMRPEARKAILDHINNALAENGYPDAGRFINYSVYGSGASYNWDEDGDFDMQMWVDIDKFNEGKSKEELMTEDDLVADIRRIVQLVNFPSFADLGLTNGCEGKMLVQYYAKPGTGSKEENLASKPYACFDLEKEVWYQKPTPITPEFYGEWFILLEPKAKDIATQASAVLESLERNIVEWSFWSQMYDRHHDERFKEIADKAQEDAEADREGAHNMFLNIFKGRMEAYGPEGEGNNDERDLMEKLLEVWGVFQRLRHAVKEVFPWEAQELPEEPLPTEEPKESRWQLTTGVMYHTGWADDIPSIQEHGLQPAAPGAWNYVREEENPEGVYLYENLEDAEHYGKDREEPTAIWEVNTDGLHLQPDAIFKEEVEKPHAWYSTDPIGPERLRRVASDPTKVSEAVHAILKDGGGTFNIDLSPAHHSDGYYSSVYGYEQTVSEGDFGESTLNAYLDMVEGHSDYLLGSWVDEGLVYLDLTKHIPDKQTAIEFGLYNRQKAIWDIAKKQAIELDPEAYEPPTAFSKVAAWKDLMEKAKRIKDQGRVHILNNQTDHVVGRVEGDHGTYTTQIWRQDPNSQAITMWDCECPWDQYAWQRTRQWKKYEGRPCSHVLALYWTAQQNAAQQPTVPEGQMQLPGMTPQPTAPPPVPFQPGAPNLEGQGLPRPGTEPVLPSGPFAPTPTPADMPVAPQGAPGALPMQPAAPGMQIDPRFLRTAPGQPVDPRFQAPVVPGGNSQPQEPGQGGNFGFPGALSSWQPYGPEDAEEEASRWAPKSDPDREPLCPECGRFGKLMPSMEVDGALQCLHCGQNWFPDDFAPVRWSMRLAAFENGTIVRAEQPLVGMDRDGRQWRVPRNSKGEVLSSDEDKTIAIFPLSTGQLQPHLVRVVADTTSFSQSHGSPFIGS